MAKTIEEALERGPATSRELQAATGKNPSWVARGLKDLGERVIRLKDGRTPRYALTRNAFGADDRIPLYRVDPQGGYAIVAYLRPVAHGGFHVEPFAEIPAMLLGDDGSGMYDDLPYFLDDLRPQGFLGRQIAAKITEISPNFPSDPGMWTADQVGRYLISNGDDLPGNLMLGQQTQLRVRRAPHPTDISDYPALADAVMAGTPPGSSAGGEQPKFTTYNRERGHVIVKFSPKDESPVARRWRDILISEFHAAQILNGTPLAAAETRLFELEGRLFLESLRFDRKGEIGRLPLISLRAVDAEFVGSGGNWPTVMSGLARRGLVSGQHLQDAASLWCFGKLISNTDMHLGNLSLSYEREIFHLAPVYDMCSMGFAPRSGDVPPFQLSIPDLRNHIQDETPVDLQQVYAAASEFWDAVQQDARISDKFMRFLNQKQPASVIRAFAQ